MATHNVMSQLFTDEPETTGTIGPNDCFVTDNVVASARNLIGGYPLTPINFADLCEFIEMVVMHERIIMTIPATTDSPLDAMVRDGILTSTMFKEATPAESADSKLVIDIYDKCLRAVADAGVFGSGILDSPDTHDEALAQALARIEVGELMLSVDHGRRKVARGAGKDLKKLRGVYKVFTDYADAVFEAAQHFHVHAYAGTSEIGYAIQKTSMSIPRSLYEELRQIYKDRVGRFLASAGYTACDIPPFAQIVLSRCKRREDITPAILDAREEFHQFRETCTSYAVRVRDANKAGRVGDIIDLQNDLDRAIEVLTKKTKTSRKDTRYIYRVWDLVKAATPWGIVEKSLDRLKEHDIESQHLVTVNGLMNVWDKLKAASPYERILRSELFGKEYALEDFASFNQYLLHVRQYFPVGKPSES